MISGKKLILSIVLLLVLSLVFSGIVSAQLTLKYANWQFQESGRSEVLEGFIDDFEEMYPDIEIEKVSISYSTYNPALTTQFEAGQGPDVLFVQDMALIPWISKGYLEPLDNLIDLTKYEAEFPNQQSTAVEAGKTYGIIYEGFPRVY